MKARLIQAMKANNEFEKNILRVALSQVESIQSAGTGTLDEKQVESILRKVKQNNVEFLATYAGKYSDAQKQKLEEENKILDQLLPELLTLDEIYQHLQGIVSELKAVPKDGIAVGMAVKLFAKANLKASGNDIKTVVEKIRQN